MAKRTDRRRMGRLCLCLVLLLASSCAAGRIIRNRLPRPSVTRAGVLFRYEAPAARQVNLAGQWNNWGGTQGGGRFDPGIDPMRGPDENGIWSIVLPLPPGRYQYKFVIDQVRWEQDPSNPDKGVDGGIENSLVLVPSGTTYPDAPGFLPVGGYALAGPTARPAAAAEATGAGVPAGGRPASPAAEVEVTFRLEAAEARTVFLAGSFNDWAPDRLAMARDPGGLWSVSLKLKPGSYAYKFVVDGRWVADPLNPETADDGQGGVNSVLTVEAP